MRNLVLICLDSVRADYFEEYASRLISQADINMCRCRAASSWTVPSHASMLTSELPHRHGVHTDNRDFTSIPCSDTFLSELPNHRTTGLSANYFAGSAHGFDNFFDKFVDIDPRVAFQLSPTEIPEDQSGLTKYYQTLVRALNSDSPVKSLCNVGKLKLYSAIEDSRLPQIWDDGTSEIIRRGVDTIREEKVPSFLFTNFMESHQPQHVVYGYDRSLCDVPSGWNSRGEFYSAKWDINVNGNHKSHEEFLRRYRSVYAASVEYLDRKISRFVERVREEADLPTTFLITADHGENLAYESERYLFEHTNSLSESLLHVPLLIINTPEAFEIDESSPFSHLDLGDLLVALAANQPFDPERSTTPAEVIGASPGLGSLSEDQREDAAVDRTIRCIYSDEMKFVWDSIGVAERFEVDHECASWESRQASDVELPTEIVERIFETSVEDATETSSETADTSVDSSAESRLRDLGYLG